MSKSRSDLNIFLEHNNTLKVPRWIEHLSESPAVVDAQVCVARVLEQILWRALGVQWRAGRQRQGYHLSLRRFAVQCAQIILFLWYIVQFGGSDRLLRRFFVCQTFCRRTPARGSFSLTHVAKYVAICLPDAFFRLSDTCVQSFHNRLVGCSATGGQGV